MIEMEQADGLGLLERYVRAGDEEAFREVVRRYVDLVYSAAHRLVDGDVHLAEDVTQTVFVDLARMAGKLSEGVMLGGWLHRHTCFVARNTMRGERRRRTRERQAVDMDSTQDHSAANLEQLAPVLDEAINELGAEDRAAIMLRFFEQRDFRSVGEAMGSQEDAARKRVGRALEKLNDILKHRGVALSATALASTLATGAVSAAPAGLAATISGAALSGAAAGGAATLTMLKIMSMNKIKAGVITALVVAGVAVPVAIEKRAETQLAGLNEALRAERARAAELVVENERLSRRAVSEPQAQRPVDDQYRELMRLRGEIGALRRETAQLREQEMARTNAPSMLSGLKANPGMWKLIREQQKAGMSQIYKGLTDRVHLETNQVAELNEMLADHVMENIDEITAVIKDGKTLEEMDRIFAAREDAFDERVKELLGPEGFAAYEEHTRNLASRLTADQFTATISTDPAEKQAKSEKLYEMLREEARLALGNAGLPDDYQLVPTLNFRNFASETAAEQSLNMLDGIYQRVETRAGGVLTPEEVEKFTAFRTNAISLNRTAIEINRKMMSPGGP